MIFMSFVKKKSKNEWICNSKKFQVEYKIQKLIKPFGILQT